jgi:serine/threonine protein kinase
MPLEAGKVLGPYEILSPFGAGGMGEVYKATDTRLDRTVAIKVLPEHVASDPDLKQRFERESGPIATAHVRCLPPVGGPDDLIIVNMK